MVTEAAEVEAVEAEVEAAEAEVEAVEAEAEAEAAEEQAAAAEAAEAAEAAAVELVVAELAGAAAMVVKLAEAGAAMAVKRVPAVADMAATAAVAMAGQQQRRRQRLAMAWRPARMALGQVRLHRTARTAAMARQAWASVLLSTRATAPRPMAHWQAHSVRSMPRMRRRQRWHTLRQIRWWARLPRIRAQWSQR